VAAIRGNILALILFAAFFVLHIVAGAADQGWLFAIAVVLIAVTAGGFPLLVAVAARARSTAELRLTVLPAAVIGAGLTAGVFWAANDRAWAWWHWPAAITIAGAVSVWTLRRETARVSGRRGSRSPA
jgi:ABC-type multidrug transport system permease subunit